MLDNADSESNARLDMLSSQYKKGSDVMRWSLLIASDILALTLSVCIAWLISIPIRQQIYPGLGHPTLYISTHSEFVLFSLLGMIVIGFSWAWGHYNQFKPFWSELQEILKMLVYVVVVNTVYLFTINDHFSRAWFFFIFIFAIILLSVFRIYIKRLMVYLGIWFKPTIIVGVGPNALNSANAIESDLTMGHKVVAFLGPDGASYSESELNGCPVIPIGDNPEKIYQRLGRPYVVFAVESFEQLNGMKSLLDKWMSICANMIIVPPVNGLPLYNAEVVHIFRYENLLLRLNNNLMRRWPRIVKRVFDLVISSLLLVFLAPLFLFFFWKIRQDGGSATYAHKRIGHNGECFDCLKFRSMIINADSVLAELLKNDVNAREEWQQDFKLKDDPRITKIGKFIRKTSLDELPQLWNILKGDMSLVGPRPIVKDEVERYGEYITYYQETRPGITGLWQVSGRNDTSYTQRVYLDVWYVRNWSLWHDIVILLKTLPVVLLRKGSY